MEINYPQPLTQPWEREAIKELCLAAHGICTGAYPDATSIRDKILDIAEAIDIEYGDCPELRYLRPPAPSSTALLECLGSHIGALAIAVDLIAKLSDADPETLGVKLLKEGHDYYQAMQPGQLKTIASRLLDTTFPPDES